MTSRELSISVRRLSSGDEFIAELGLHPYRRRRKVLISNGRKLTLPCPTAHGRSPATASSMSVCCAAGPGGQRAAPSSGRAPYSHTITSPPSSSAGLTVSRLTFATATTRTAGEKSG